MLCGEGPDGKLQRTSLIRQSDKKIVALKAHDSPTAKLPTETGGDFTRQLTAEGALRDQSLQGDYLI